MEDVLANPDDFLAQFSVAFSWDYPDDWSLNDVLCSIFYIIGDNDTRSQDQVVCNSVQAAGNGVCLTQPHPETDIIPCELTLKAHPNACEFCVTKIVVVSEARNTELYVDEMYEKTAKGMMLTLKKGKNAALYESEFDLSAHIQGSNKISIKFISMPDKQILRMQAVVVKVTRCSHDSLPTAQKRSLNSGSIEMDKVRDMMSSMGLDIPSGAQQLMTQIERQQNQGMQLQQLLALGLGQLASPLTQQASARTPVMHDTPSKSTPHRTRPQFEESVLANAILNTEKSKRETHRIIEEQERKAEHDAQINVLKQMLMGTPQHAETPGRKGRENSKYRSFHEGDVYGDSYKLLLERLISETTATGDNVLLNEAETHRDGFNNFMHASNRASFRSDYQSNTAASAHTSRPVSCCSEFSDREFQRALNDLDNAHRKSAACTMFPANSKRCQECGCPGCLSVYNSITTNIYAMEERLVGRMDLRIQEISRHIDSKFDALYDAFFAQREKIATQLIDSIPRTTEKKRPSKDSILQRSENP